MFLHRDEKYLDKLRSIGMTQDDEYKLTAMREYIWKLSRARQNARPKGREDEPPGVTKVMSKAASFSSSDSLYAV